jgi:hypothetical protein
MWPPLAASHVVNQNVMNNQLPRRISCFVFVWFAYNIFALLSLIRSVPAPTPEDLQTPKNKPKHLLRSTHGSTTTTTTVALLIPVRSRHGTTHVSELSIFQELLPSFFDTIQCDNSLFDIRFVLYVGFDAGDEFWDDPNNREGVYSTYEAMWSRTGHKYPAVQNLLPPTLVIKRYVGMLSAPCWIWNQLFTDAYHSPTQSIDYFMQINDDTRILSTCWAHDLLTVLDKLPYRLGVVGPMDIQNTKVLTQAMVARTHFDIFETLYPHDFKNWYSDDWLSMVYNQGRTYMVDQVKMLNTNSQGTRYKQYTKIKTMLHLQVDQGRRQIERWLEQQREAGDR